MKIDRVALVIIAALLGTNPCFPAAVPLATGPVLGAVVFSGSTAYAAPQLFSTYHAQLGSAINRDCARAIATALSDLYERDGYVRPEVSIDDALVADGILRVNVHEARVTRVVFDGDPGGQLPALERIATRLTDATPLRGDDVQAALRDMRAVPGMDVTATTRRDETARNAYELVVRTSFSRVDGVVRINNRGTDEVGPAFVLGQVYVNGLLGGREKIGVIFAAATTTDEYLGGGLAFDAPLGERGTRANLLLFQSRSAPNEVPVDLDDRYTRKRATVRVSHPVATRSTYTLSAAGALEAEDLAILRAGTRIRDDRLRVIEGSLRAGLRSAGGLQHSAGLQLRHGLDGFGAGCPASPRDRGRAYQVLQRRGLR